MKKTYLPMLVAMLSVSVPVLMLMQGCTQTTTETRTTKQASAPDTATGQQYPEQRQRAALSSEEMLNEGKRLVAALDCDVCHSPKTFPEGGHPQLVEGKRLSGHPANEKLAPYDAATVRNGWTLTSPSFTAWVGVWGTSFAANITPDNETGIGRWQEENFFRVMREGKYHGLENTRPILPPMPWEAYRELTDEELRMIFSYLKSLPPVNNAVPAPLPPPGV